MSKILLLTSSPRGAESSSTKVATELAQALAKKPGATLTVRDLVASPLPAIGPDFANSRGAPPEARNADQAKAIAFSDVLVDELLAADTLVIGAGMMNFSVPAGLKNWIDWVARPGRTFSYASGKPEGLAKGKRVYVVASSGGMYTGPESGDFLVPYLKFVLAFMGMADVEVIKLEAMGFGPEAVDKAFANARARIAELAA